MFDYVPADGLSSGATLARASHLTYLKNLVDAEQLVRLRGDGTPARRPLSTSTSPRRR